MDTEEIWQARFWLVVFVVIAFFIGYGVADRKGTKRAVETCTAVMKTYVDYDPSEFCNNFVRWDNDMKQ